MRTGFIPPVEIARPLDLELILNPATDEERILGDLETRLGESWGPSDDGQGYGLQKGRQYTILVIDKDNESPRPKPLKNIKVNFVNGKGFNMNVDIDMPISNLRHAIFEIMKKKVRSFFSIAPETMEFKILLGGDQIRLDDAGKSLAQYGVTNEGVVTFYMEERGKVVNRPTNSWNERQKRKYNPDG